MLTVGEMFCGAGGMAIGAKQAGFEYIWGLDWEKDAADTARQVIPIVLNVDVNTINFAKMPRVDVLAFGFPCNDFTVSGEKKGLEGYYGGLYKQCARALDEMQPKYFVAENVPGIKRHLDHILDRFRLSGYNVSYQMYRLEDYGLPQARHRYFIVGINKFFGWHFEHPEPTSERVTVREALADIPQDAPNQERQKHGANVLYRLAYAQRGIDPKSDDMPEGLRYTKTARNNNFKIVDPDDVAWTVIAGGSGSDMWHWSDMRALSNRERATLQGFPVYHKFEGGRVSVKKQIGMAVPPLGARVVFQALMEQHDKFMRGELNGVER